MFSRQIAVMKGQAWNVVETLKTPDHGPLELTRRAKVCVWDDLVEIPVAVPMRATSSEVRRRAEEDYNRGIEEEMDIGAVSSSAPVHDLLGIASPPADLPHPGRFELSEAAVDDDAQSPPAEELATSSTATSPTRTRGRPRLPGTSVSGPQRTHNLNMYTPRQERRYSFATVMGRRNSNNIAHHLYGNGSQGDHGYDDDDVEGDLGFAAAEGMEGNQRKVIVERLEPVKARNPVFTWC